jgi:phage anti-repressor protein
MYNLYLELYPLLQQDKLFDYVVCSFKSQETKNLKGSWTILLDMTEHITHSGPVKHQGLNKSKKQSNTYYLQIY